jgi:hypothetical protein
MAAIITGRRWAALVVRCSHIIAQAIIACGQEIAKIISDTELHDISQEESDLGNSSMYQSGFDQLPIEEECCWSETAEGKGDCFYTANSCPWRKHAISRRSKQNPVTGRTENLPSYEKCQGCTKLAARCKAHVLEN